MDEMDMGDQIVAPPTEGDAIAAEEATRAEQLRAEARAALQPPTHFDTPSWLGPSTREFVPPQVPVQPEPVHDQVHVYAPTPVDDSIPETAHWVEHRKPRVLVGVMLTLTTLGALASLVFTVLDRSALSITGLAVCGVLAVIIRGTLMSAALTTVDLKSSTLRVRQDNELSVFNLADPATRVEVTGAPGTPAWKVVLESVHHREITLTSAHVDSEEFDHILLHYRAVAERERQERHDRYNR